MAANIPKARFRQTSEIMSMERHAHAGTSKRYFGSISPYPTYQHLNSMPGEPAIQCHLRPTPALPTRTTRQRYLEGRRRHNEGLRRVYSVAASRALGSKLFNKIVCSDRLFGSRVACFLLSLRSSVEEGYTKAKQRARIYNDLIGEISRRQRRATG
jgi:hypothetical protein